MSAHQLAATMIMICYTSSISDLMYTIPVVLSKDRRSHPGIHQRTLTRGSQCRDPLDPDTLRSLGSEIQDLADPGDPPRQPGYVWSCRPLDFVSTYTRKDVYPGYTSPG